jgi:hypothetical protein
VKYATSAKQSPGPSIGLGLSSKKGSTCRHQKTIDHRRLSERKSTADVHTPVIQVWGTGAVLNNTVNLQRTIAAAAG